MTVPNILYTVHDIFLIRPHGIMRSVSCHNLINLWFDYRRRRARMMTHQGQQVTHSHSMTSHQCQQVTNSQRMR